MVLIDFSKGYFPERKNSRLDLRGIKIEINFSKTNNGRGISGLFLR
jgi:hypothetical protein